MSMKNDIKINDWLIEDVSWTLSHYLDNILNSYMNSSLSGYRMIDNNEPLKTAANAALIVAKHGCGDCYTIDDFIDCVECGGFNDFDGSGEFVSKTGEVLSRIRCNAEWLRYNTPKDAAFIMWYNK